MACHTVVIISADSELRTLLAAHVTQAGFATETAESLPAWLTAAKYAPVHCLVLDMPMGALVEPDQAALFAAACSSRRVLALTAVGDVPTAVQAIRQGASDVVQRSAEHRNILHRIKQLVSMPV